MSAFAGVNATKEPDWFDEEGELKEDLEFDRLKESIWKEGYKEGLSSSKETSLQSGFEDGYVRSVTTFLPLGEIRGRLQAMLRFATAATPQVRMDSAKTMLFKIDAFIKDCEKQPEIAYVEGHTKLVQFNGEKERLQIKLMAEMHSLVFEGNQILESQPFGLDKVN